MCLHLLSYHSHVYLHLHFKSTFKSLIRNKEAKFNKQYEHTFLFYLLIFIVNLRLVKQKSREEQRHRENLQIFHVWPKNLYS